MDIQDFKYWYEYIKIQIKFLDMKPTLCEIKHTLGRINGRADITEEKIWELKDIAIEISKMKNQRK